MYIKINTKTLLFILLGIVVGVILSQVFKKDISDKKLVSIVPDEVSKIEIVGFEHVVLERRDTSWFVLMENGVTKPASPVPVGMLIDSLNAIKTFRRVAIKEAYWPKYGVGPQGIRFKAWNGDDLLADIVFGTSGVSIDQKTYAYVRPYEEKSVYETNFSRLILQRRASWYRNQWIMKLDQEALLSVNFDYPDSSFVLSNNEQWLVDGTPADPASVSRYFKALENVASPLFFDEELVSEPTHTLTFSYADQPDLILEGYKSDKGMAIKSTYNQDEVFMSPPLTRRIFKGKRSFLKSD